MSTTTNKAAKPKDLLAKKPLIGFKLRTGAGGIALVKTCTVKGGSCKGAVK